MERQQLTNSVLHDLLCCGPDKRAHGYEQFCFSILKFKVFSCYFILLQLAVIITDGNQTKTGQYTKLSDASRGIKNKGVTVYAVGVGSGVDQAELEEIASRPEYVFISSSFKELQSISSGVTRRLCEGELGDL